MRRILVVATLGLAFVSAAACADTDTPTASSTSAAAATNAATSVDKKTACTNLKKATDDFRAKVVELTPKMAAAVADTSKAPAVGAEVLVALQSFGAAYGANASAIDDPQLKAAVEADMNALNTAIAGVTAAGGDLKKVEDTLAAQDFENAGEAVERLCA